MILDCFQFCKEMDMLEGRLEYLYNSVDWFIIIESTHTHAGVEKELNYLKNISRYQKYSNKILYFPYMYENIQKLNLQYKPNNLDLSSDHWELEKSQRNYIYHSLKFFPDNSIVMIGDIDEIPEKGFINFASDIIQSGKEKAILSLQKMFINNFQNYSAQPWMGTVFTTVANVKEIGSAQWFRDFRSTLPGFWNAGYHLTYWGSVEDIAYKIKNFAHQEYNKEEYTDLEKIKQRLYNNSDLFDRGQNSSLPIHELNPEILKIFGHAKI